MLLKKGSVSKEVIEWQRFLLSKGYKIGSLDGIFGEKVRLATIEFQKANNLIADGIVGDNTFKAAGIKIESEYYPPVPNDLKLPTFSNSKKMFGIFKYKLGKNNSVVIIDDWVEKNIVDVKMPQLIGVEAAPKDGVIQFHRLGVKSLLGAFDEIEQKGLKSRIISFAGSFYPRMIRGSKTTLSNHSFGTAFDLNAPENWLGQKPAKIGQKGCLLELVPIFNKWGFFWGGHYQNRLDGMHFELAKLI